MKEELFLKMNNELETLAAELVSKLKQKQLHITTAESCTGGMIAQYIVNISGASEVFEEGYVTYSNEVKHKLLGVEEEAFVKYTAVSEEVARQMADGAQKASGSDITVSVTGLAGPDGDEEHNIPVGTVYNGCAYDGHIMVQKHVFDGDRQEVRMQSVAAAMKLAICMLEG